MKVFLEYKLTIQGDIPCGRNGFKAEDEITASLKDFPDALRELISEEIACETIDVSVDEIK